MIEFKQAHMKDISQHRVLLKVKKMLYHTKLTREQYDFINHPLEFIDNLSTVLNDNPVEYMYVLIRETLAYIADQRYYRI